MLNITATRILYAAHSKAKADYAAANQALFVANARLARLGDYAPVDVTTAAEEAVRIASERRAMAFGHYEALANLMEALEA